MMTPCDRCNQPTVVRIMSMFNLDMICMDCKDKEKKHPRYFEAELADRKAARRGNRQFEGIGLPQDLGP
jgi:hypothetical protein